MAPEVNGGTVSVLTLSRARLCPDCDVITQALVCPVCGRSQTSRLAEWIPPCGVDREPTEADMPSWEL